MNNVLKLIFNCLTLKNKTITTFCFIVLLLPLIVLAVIFGFVMFVIIFDYEFDREPLRQSNNEEMFHSSIPDSFSWKKYSCRHAAGDTSVQGYFYIDKEDLFTMYPRNNWVELSNNVEKIIDVLDCNITTIDTTDYSMDERKSFLLSCSQRDYQFLEMECNCYRYLTEAFSFLSGKNYFIEDRLIGIKFKYSPKETLSLIAEQPKHDERKIKVYIDYCYNSNGGLITMPEKTHK